MTQTPATLTSTFPPSNSPGLITADEIQKEQ